PSSTNSVHSRRSRSWRYQLTLRARSVTGSLTCAIRSSPAIPAGSAVICCLPRLAGRGLTLFCPWLSGGLRIPCLPAAPLTARLLPRRRLPAGFRPSYGDASATPPGQRHAVLQGASVAVFVVAADPELEPVALVAAFRRPVQDRVVGHQELDAAA